MLNYIPYVLFKLTQHIKLLWKLLLAPIKLYTDGGRRHRMSTYTVKPDDPLGTDETRPDVGLFVRDLSGNCKIEVF